MVLLEFHYWTDVVMWGIVANLILTAILAISLTRKKKPKPTYCADEELRKQIFCKLEKAIEKIKNIV